MITSWVTLEALDGALVAGVLVDEVGRRRAAILAGVLFAAGALLETVAPGAGVLALGRVITGIAVGFALTVAPLYGPRWRRRALLGRFVSAYQLAITVGIFLAYLADDALTWSGRWRAMFDLAVIPGVLLVLGFLCVPESVRWLIDHDRRRRPSRRW